LTTFNPGDIVTYRNSSSNNTRLFHGKLTTGRRYSVEKVRSDDLYIQVMGDHGRIVCAMTNRFELAIAGRKTAIVQQRELRKKVEAERKARAKAKREAEVAAKLAATKAADLREYTEMYMSARKNPQMLHYFNGVQVQAPSKPKAPLLFTSVSDSDVYSALSTMLSDIGHRGLNVVGIEKTTEGFRLTVDHVR
jgi:hypothetical protein